jgi:hypothetical protein
MTIINRFTLIEIQKKGFTNNDEPVYIMLLIE